MGVQQQVAGGLGLTVGPNGFKKIGSTFAIAGKAFYGEVIASDSAIYFILRQRRNDLASGAGGAIGGLIGGAIAGALMGAFGSSVSDKVVTLQAAELPEDVKQHPTWPVKKLKDNIEIVVLARDAIAPPGMVHPKFSNLLLLNSAGQRIKIEYTLFQGGGVRAFLETAGWPLVWGGSTKLLGKAAK